MYIPREVEGTIDSMLAQGKVLLVTGARQVGKTTVLREHLGSAFDYVSLENPIDYTAARSDALLFFEGHDMPLIIDEVRRVPELFGTVKFLVDQSDRRGQLVLTGSQTYHLMKGVSESLAGRVRVIEMAGLSLRELTGAVGAGRTSREDWGGRMCRQFRRASILGGTSTAVPCPRCRTAPRTGTPSTRTTSEPISSAMFVTSSTSGTR
ncbi:ATP-binding protein [Propionibacterium australiense]|uniref:ATP-binding protein n=1 Tax=Propionibacterium australiense TaxID=119981 RepID=UPI0018D5A4DF|nr:AAA family ATPase [Propionibacterium australiense]